MENRLSEARIKTWAMGQLAQGGIFLLLWHLWAANWVSGKFDLSDATFAGLRVEGLLYYLPAILFALALVGAAVLVYPLLGRYLTKDMSIRVHILAALFLWGTYVGKVSGIAPSAVELGATIFVSICVLVTGIVIHIREKAGLTGFFSNVKGEIPEGAKDDVPEPESGSGNQS